MAAFGITTKGIDEVGKIRSKAGSRLMTQVHVLEIVIHGQKGSEMQTLVLMEKQREKKGEKERKSARE